MNDLDASFVALVAVGHGVESASATPPDVAATGVTMSAAVAAGMSKRLGKEGERGGVGRADDGEVSVVEGGDALFAVSFGERDETGVGAAETQVGVLDDKVVDALPVGDGERREA